MRAKSIVNYFYFGTVIRYLQDVDTGYKVWGKDLVAENVQSFFDFLEQLDLQVTSRAARGFKVFWQTEFKEEVNDVYLTKEQAQKTRHFLTEIRNTLFAELEGFEAYLVNPKRLDINKLIKDVPSLFPPDVFDALPPIARYDFSEAGKCIAFERPTAAAFHLLRGTEDVLKFYYCANIKTKRVNLMWGPMLQDLKDRKKTKSKTTLINNMDDIRLSFRNPTQHPDKIYDIEEVQDLWGRCIEAVNRMIKDLPAT